MQIPAQTLFGYLGFVLLLFGIFLMIAGAGIINVEQVTVKHGRRTLLLGVTLAVIGVILLIPEVVRTPVLSSEPSPDTSTAKAPVEPSETLSVTETAGLAQPLDVAAILSDPSGQLTFVSERDGNWEIYLITGDGTKIARLTFHPARDWAPTWSPDGEWLAFTSDRDGDEDIYIMKPDGTQLRQLTENTAFDCCADWSPDGRRIAFNSNWPDGDQDVYVVNVDGTELKNLTDFPGDDWHPAWSPDATTIAFDARRDGQAEIYTLNTDQFDPKRLTTLFSAQRAPDWSPDGAFIVYDSNQQVDDPNEQDDHDIMIMNADGTGQTRIIDDPADDRWPDWSKTSDQIVFTSYRSGNGDIYLVGINGENLERITDHPAEDTGAVWRP